MDPNETPTPEAELLSALDAGIAAATPEAPPEPEVKPDVVPEVEAPIPGTEEARVAAEKAAAEAAKPEVKPEGEVAPDAKPEPDKAVEDEITALGLKEKSAARFRELSAEVKELAPLREAMKAAGIADVADLPKLMEKSATADQLIEMVMSTGASSEQYGKSLDYLALVNKATAGDRAAAEQAFSVIGEEYAALAKALGKEIPGLFDPLAEHPDLLADIEAGDLTRPRALELAATRNQVKAGQQVREQQDAGRSAAQAEHDGKAALQAFDAQMQASDPAYLPRREQLSTMVAFIRQTLPPDKWLAATQKAYAALPPVPVAPAPVVKPAVSPMRPGPARSAPLAPVTDDPMEALNMGIAAAGGVSA